MLNEIFFTPIRPAIFPASPCSATVGRPPRCRTTSTSTHRTPRLHPVPSAFIAASFAANRPANLSYLFLNFSQYSRSAVVYSLCKIVSPCRSIAAFIRPTSAISTPSPMIKDSSEVRPHRFLNTTRLRLYLEDCGYRENITAQAREGKTAKVQRIEGEIPGETPDLQRLDHPHPPRRHRPPIHRPQQNPLARPRLQHPPRRRQRNRQRKSLKPRRRRMGQTRKRRRKQAPLPIRTRRRKTRIRLSPPNPLRRRPHLRRNHFDRQAMQ